MKRDVDRLRAVAAAYQRDVVVPHCPTCSRPCCKLTDVVLEMDWPRAQALYAIGTTKRAFDAALQDGSGPPHIRRAGASYYAFRSPCPAYDDAAHACRVYGTAAKPPSCDDFPAYVDGDALTVDARCEAVDVDAVATRIGGDVERVVPDDRFPFLVTLRPAPPPRRGDAAAPPRPGAPSARARGARARSVRRR